MPTKNKKQDATTAMLSGNFSEIAVQSMNQPIVLEGTSWLVSARLFRFGETIFASPVLHYAGIKPFDPEYLVDRWSITDLDNPQPMNIDQAELLSLKEYRQRVSKTKGELRAMVHEVILNNVMNIIDHKAKLFDYHIQKTKGGRFALVGFDYPTGTDENYEILFRGEKEGDLIAISSEEPNYPRLVDDGDKWLVEEIVKDSGDLVLIPIRPGKMALANDRLWKK
jgi:hypothetical protein